jgi:hypothetical protein
MDTMNNTFAAEPPFALRLLAQLRRPMEFVTRAVRRYLAERHAHDRIVAYLRLPGLKALHVGRGRFPLDGWLSGGGSHDCGRDVFLDIAQPLPLPLDSLDAMYVAADALEPLSAPTVRLFFRESHRALRPAGVLRIAVSAAGARWTFDSLATALVDAGFTTIVRCAPGCTQSPWDELALPDRDGGAAAPDPLIVEATAAAPRTARTTAVPVTAPPAFARTGSALAS